MPWLEGGTALGQEVVATPVLRGFQGSSEVITNWIPFQAEPTDLQRTLPISISVILGTYLICFLSSFVFFFIPLCFQKSGKEVWLHLLSKTPSSICKCVLVLWLDFSVYKISIPWIKDARGQPLPALCWPKISLGFFFSVLRLILPVCFHSFICKRALRVHSIPTCSNRELSASPVLIIKIN